MQQITVTVGPVTLTLRREDLGDTFFVADLGSGLIVAAVQRGEAWLVAVVDARRAPVTQTVGHARRSTVQAAAIALPSVAVEAVVLARAA